MSGEASSDTNSVIPVAFKDRTDSVVFGNLQSISNFRYLVSVKSGVTPHYGELWFQCPQCKNGRPPERMFFIQADTELDELSVQNLSTFFTIEDNGNLAGLNEGFDVKGAITVSCVKCLAAGGVDTSNVPVEFIETTKRNLT